MPLETVEMRRLVDQGGSVPKETAERLQLQKQIEATTKRNVADDAFVERQVARRVDIIEGSLARLEKHRRARDRVELKEWQAELSRRSLAERLEEKAVRAVIPELQRASDVRKVQRLRKEMLNATHEMYALVQRAEKDGNYDSFHRRLEQLTATATPTAFEAARQSLGVTASVSAPSLSQSRPLSKSSRTMPNSRRTSRRLERHLIRRRG
jgi:hypothetical protein